MLKESDKKLKSMKKEIMRLCLMGIGAFFLCSCGNSVSNNSNEIELPRVIITTDINNVGGDPDDKQSLAHLLMYADEVEIKAIIPDYWEGKGIEATNQTINEYEKDFNNSSFGFAKNNYPNPDSLRAKIAQNNEDAINRIITEANRPDERPLYILVWGNMSTIQQSLFKAPEIADKLRILTIATNIKAPNPNHDKNVDVQNNCKKTNWNGDGRDTIFNDQRFNNLWWIENDWAYNGMFEGQSPRSFLNEIKEYGNLGYHIWDVVQPQEWAHYFRAGDTPTLLYLLEPSNHDNPAEATWAGKFTKPFPDKKPNYWIDDAGIDDWNYKNPCKTWHLADTVYMVRTNNLIKNREEMYSAFRLKMRKLYEK